MKYYELFSILILLTAFISFINEVYLKQIKTIGLVITSVVVAIGVVLLNNMFDAVSIPITKFIEDLDKRLLE